ncbi:MAG TPA: tetratricopeptide repeat protein [Vicinamibacterales bacterium]
MTIVLVAAGTVLAFLPTLGNGFVNFDDDRLLLHNPYLRLAPAQTLRWIFSTTFLGHYQPLAWLSLWMDYAIGGVSPVVYHVDSLLWHAAAGVVAYSVLVDLLSRTEAGRSAEPVRLRACAAAGALFWAVHPLRVESVAWISERRDPVSLVCWLLALRACLLALDAGSERQATRWRIGSYALLTLSLLAKAWGMTFFLTLLAIDIFPLRRLPVGPGAVTDARYRAVWREKIPYALLGAAAGAGAWLAQRVQPDTMLSTGEWSGTARFLQAAYGLCFYVWKTLWPTNLAAMYELPARLQPSLTSLFVVCLIVAAAAAAAIVVTARRHPEFLAAAIAYVATVAPVLGFAQSGPQLVADRYAYVSSLAFSAIVAGGLLILSQRSWSRVAAPTIACLVALGALTWRQTEVWHDSATLWLHALETGHPSYVAYVNYGQAVRAEGRLDEAIASYRRALAIRPQAGNGWYNLANSLKAAGRNDEAERAYIVAIDHLSWKVDAQVNLGNLYFARHELPAAIRQYRAATEMVAQVAPAEFTPEPYLYLGIALSDSGDRDGARTALGVALRYPATRARAETELRRMANR